MCHNACSIPEGKTGICGVRANIQGQLKLLVYGKTNDVAIDPIEKKPLYHMLPGSPVVSIGTIGCNFSCAFCQNYFISQASKRQSLSDLTKRISAFDSWPPKKVLGICLTIKSPAIAFTYNEPTIFTEYAIDCMKLARKHGIKGIYVTNGYMSQTCLDYIGPYIDAYNVDLKSFREDYYRTICGAHLQPVLDTIRELYHRGKWIEVTTLLIEGKNDSDAELGDLTRFLASVSCDIPWHISAAHPEYKMNDIPVTKLSTLKRAYKIGKKAGLRFIYLGNVASTSYDDTYCPKCHIPLIKRRGYSIVCNKIKNGKCADCHTAIPGIWK